MEKTYAVHIERISTDYVLIHADSFEEAREKVTLLMEESSPAYTLGEDGSDDTITNVTETVVHGQYEQNDLEENETLYSQLIASDGASV